MRVGTERVTRGLIAGGLALMIVAPSPLRCQRAAAQEVGRTSGEHGAVTNWASDGATQAASAPEREPVEASRVTLDVGGGAVVVQWSLSYDAYVSVKGGPGDRYPVAEVQAIAALERDDAEIARWTLGEDQARGRKDEGVQARLTGTTSGLFVDRAAGIGRRTYLLKVWNDRRSGVVTVGTRTMLCEER